MKKTAAKKKPPTPGIEEQIEALHSEIDSLVEKHVDQIAKGCPGVPRSVLHGLATARARGGSGCKCGVYSHLFGIKKP